MKLKDFLWGSYEEKRGGAAAHAYVLRVALAIFMSEALIMTVLWLFPMENELSKIFTNSVVLTLILCPPLYLFVYLPLLKELQRRVETQKELEAAEKELQENREHLEELVMKRTGELSEANRSLELKIAEHGLAVEALRASEKRFRSLFNLASDAIFLLDPLPGNGPLIAEANGAACAMHGYAREEILGKPITSLISSGSVRKSNDAVTRLLAGETFTFEIDHVRKDGSTFPVEVSALFIITDRPFILAIERDITRRKLAEETLKRHGEHLEELVKEGTTELRAINEELEKEISERKIVEEELRSSREQLRSLSSHLQALMEEERTKIAREIHDELGQVMTALKMDLFWLRDRFADHALLNEKTTSMAQLVDSTIKTVKRICADLRPGVLDHLGLVAAIEWQAGEFEKRTHIACETRFSPDTIILDRDRATAIFRIFQEALTNVMRHAQATKVIITLEEKGGKITLAIQDNGKGISAEKMAKPQSFGLIGMRERVHFFRGEIEIKGIQNTGTLLMITLPLEGEA